MSQTIAEISSLEQKISEELSNELEIISELKREIRAPSSPNLRNSQNRSKGLFTQFAALGKNLKTNSQQHCFFRAACKLATNHEKVADSKEIADAFTKCANSILPEIETLAPLRILTQIPDKQSAFHKAASKLLWKISTAHPDDNIKDEAQEIISRQAQTAIVSKMPGALATNQM